MIEQDPSMLIRLNEVVKSYPLYNSPIRQVLGYLHIGTKNVKRKTALNKVNLSIRQGERVGIIGHNGSGKTTLLRLVCGYTQANAGEILINGKIQALMQTGYGFNEDLSGLENIRNALIYNGLSSKDRHSAEVDIIDFVELGDYINHPVKTYSLGMRTRLEFAAATAIQPDVLVIDEVLGAGDGYFVRKCADRMRKLVSGTTLLLVSHSLEQINEYCDRVIWMDDGKVREDGPKQKILPLYREAMAIRTAHIRSVVLATPDEKQDFHEKNRVLKKIRSYFSHLGTENTHKLTLSFASTDSKALSLQTGEEIALKLSLSPAQDSRPVVLGFTREGAFIFELDSCINLAPGSHTIEMHNSRLGVGVGNHILIAALKDPLTTDIQCIANDFLELQIAATNWSDPPLVHLDGAWTSGATHQSIQSKISGWV